MSERASRGTTANAVEPGGEDRFAVVAEMVPAKHVAERVRSGDERVLKLLLTKKNRIGVRNPVVTSLAERSDAAARFGLPWRDAGSFHWVVVTLGCLPDPACRFAWLEVAIELAGGEQRSVACTLYPEKSEDEVHVVEKVGSSLDLDLALAGLPFVKVIPELSRERTYERRQYRTVSYGRLGSTPRWRFSATSVNPEISGDMSIVALVASPPGVACAGSISLSAQVQLKSALPKLPLVLARSAKDVASLSFGGEG